MIKKILLIWTFMITVVQAQDWSADLYIAPNPSPYVSDWLTDPNSARLTLNNHTSKRDVVYVEVTVTDDDGSLVFRGGSPRVLVLPGEPFVFYSTDLNDWKKLSVHSDLENQIQRSGMLPESDGYEVCINVVNQWGEPLIEDFCRFVDIIHAEPPELVFPIENEMIQQGYPNFQWLPAGNHTGVIYTMRIVELTTNQNPERALQSNYPFFEKFDITSTNFIYPLDAPAFERNKAYAWEVVALDALGRPATKNYGRSETGVFSTPEDFNSPLSPALELVSPVNHSAVGGGPLTFEWGLSPSNAGQDVFYTVSVYEMNQGVSPEQAASFGPLVYSNDDILTETKISISDPSNYFSDSGLYAWRVRALNAFGEAAASNGGFSDVNVFAFYQGSESEPPPSLVDTSGFKLPEKLPVLNGEIAYLELRKEGKNLIDFSFSSDSSEIIIKSSSSPLYFPKGKGADEAGTAKIPAVVDLSFDRYSLEITKGGLIGRLPAEDELILGSDGKIPLTVKEVSYNSASSSSLIIKGGIRLFGKSFSVLTEYVVNGKGEISTRFNSLSLSEPVPLVRESDKLNLFIQSLNGELTASLLSDNTEYSLNATGRLEFSGLRDRPSIPVELSISPGMTNLISSNGSVNLSFPCLDVDFNFQGLTCEYLNYYPSMKAWAFDLKGDLSWKFQFLQESFTLPNVSDVHISRLGLEIPRTELNALGIDDFLDYENVLVKPYAFRSPGTSFDWFHWDGTDVPALSFYFDMELIFPTLRKGFEKINQNPLTALNLEFKNGQFIGGVEKRNYLNPVEVLFNDEEWGFSMDEMAGEFDEKGIFQASVRGALLVPSYFQDRIISLDSSRIRFEAPGLLSGMECEVEFSQAIHWDFLKISMETSKIIFQKNQSEQELLLDFNGAIQIPHLVSSEIKAEGEGIMELVSGELREGNFAISSPFGFSLPRDEGILNLRCLKGAKISGAKLILNNEKGEMVLPGGAREIVFMDDFTLGLPGLEYQSGRARFTDGFAFRLTRWLGGGNSLNWESAPLNSTVIGEKDEVIFNLPVPTELKNGILKAAGESQGLFRIKGKTYSEIKGDFSDDFAINVSPWGVKKGKGEFFIGGEKVAVLDSAGFRLTDYFGATLSSDKLPLPDTSIAYLELENNENITIEEVNGNLKITTLENKNTPVYLPSLKYGGSDVPFLPARVDVLVDPLTMVVLSGEIVHDTLSILSLSERDVPLEVRRLNYDANHELRVGVSPVSPPALRGEDAVFDSVLVTENGISSFNKGYLGSYSNTPSKNRIVLGENMAVELNGMKANMLASPPEIAFSGDVYASCFSDGEGNEVPLHFTAEVTPRGPDFTLHLSHLAADGYRLPLGCGELEILEKNGELAAEIVAPMDSSYFAVKVSAIYTVSGLADDFSLTFNHVELNGDGITVPSLDLQSGEEQVFSLFGTQWTLSGEQKVDFVKAPMGVSLDLRGTARIFGKNIPFDGLKITSQCSIEDRVFVSEKTFYRDSLLFVDSLSIKDDRLNISGAVKAPEPFTSDGPEKFNLRLNSLGERLEGGNSFADLKFTIVDKVDYNKPGTVFGKQGLEVTARLSELILDLGESVKELTGAVNLGVETVWPGGGKVNFSGELPLKASESPVWTIGNQQKISVEFAGLLEMNVETVTIPDTSEFQLRLAGDCAPMLPGALASGGIEFDRFLLKKEDFEFGAIYDGNLNIGGLVIEINSFSFGKNIDVSTFDADFSAGTCEESEKTIADFYLDFSGSLSLSLTAFGGGIDRLLVYKTDDFFHLLIQNAYITGGDFLNGGLDLIADVPLQTNDFQFKFIIGGHVDFMGKGMAAVGELSFKETTLGDNTFKAPGFGIFLAAVGVDIDLKPLPIVINDFGAGLFFNPAPEVEEIVRRHVGLNNSDLDQADFFASLNEYKESFAEQMTFLEMYLYGKISVPKDKVLSGKALVLIATDKVRIDCKFDIGDTTMQKICKITARGFLEVGAPQDMSSWPYAAGNLTLGVSAGSMGVGSEFVRLPSLGEAKLEFYIAGAETWAVHGYLDAYLFALLHTDFEFFFGPPGFVVSGSVTKGFDVVVVKVEAGMEVCVFFRWNEPRIWGGYGSVWVEGSLLGGVLASARGEMGAALVGEPDFYLYGYAELTGSVLGISKTFEVWAQWKDGEIDAGTGEGEGMQEAIAYLREIANEIMGQTEDVESEIISLRQAELAQLNTEQIRAIVANLKNGMNAFYTETMKADQQMVFDALSSNTSRERRLKRAFNQYVDRVLEVFSDSKMDELNQNLENWETASENAVQALDSLLAQYQDAFNSIQTELSGLEFALDTLTLVSSTEYVLSDPVSVSTRTDPETGVTLPFYEIDGRVAEQNRENAEEVQKAMKEWLTGVAEKVAELRELRKSIYDGIGPNSSIAEKQEVFNGSLLDEIHFSKELLKSSSNLYEEYFQAMNDLRDFWNVRMSDGSVEYIHNLLKQARYNNPMLQAVGVAIREDALKKLSDGTIELPSDVFQGWQKYDLLTQHFYRTVPTAFLNFALMSLDSVFRRFSPIYNKSFDARRDVHREFTKRTDLIWDQYALLSDNLFQVYSEYVQNGISYQERTGGLIPGFEEDKEYFEKLKKEFIFPGTEFNIEKGESDRYEPVPILMNWSGETLKSSEFAFRISMESDTEEGYQSFGGLNQMNLEFLLNPGWLMWKYNVVDGASTWEIESSLPEMKEYSLRSRVRNLAGHAAEYGSYDMKLAGEGRETRVTPTQEPYDYEIYHIYMTSYPSCEYYSNRVVLNETNSLKVNFTIENGRELRKDLNYKAIINRIDFSADDDNKSETVFGPVPVVPVLSESGEYEFVMENVDIEPNSILPYKIVLNSYSADGKLYGSCFLYQEGLFYYDTSPPVIPINAKIELMENGWDLYGKIPKAYEQPFPGGSGKMVSDFNNYEVIYYMKGQSPDTMDWRPLSDYVEELPHHWGTYNRDENYPKIIIPLDYYPYVDSTFFSVRVKNTLPYRDNGYSKVYTLPAPTVKDEVPPTEAYVHFKGLDENGDLLISLSRLGRDSQSGVKGYAFQLVSYRDSSVVLRPFKNTGEIDLNGDSADVNNNFVLPLPERLKNELPAKMSLKTRVYDRCGNYKDGVTEIMLPPSWDMVKTEIKVPEELKPCKLKIMSELDLEKAKRGELYGIEFSLGTSPGGTDIFKNKFFNLSLDAKQGEENVKFFDLPDSLGANRTLYFTGKLMNKQFVRSGKLSVSVTMPYVDMIKDIRQEMDKIVLEIAAPGFNGSKEANYQYALGVTNYIYTSSGPVLKGLNPYDFTLRPYPDAGEYDFYGPQVQKDGVLEISVSTKDLSPLTVVALKAVALDGESSVSYKNVKIIPPAPVLTGEIVDENEGLVLNLSAGIGGRVGSAVFQGRPFVNYSIGLDKGGDGPFLKDSIFVYLYNTNNNGQKNVNIQLPDSIRFYEKIYVRAVSVTALGMVSKDTAILELKVPLPPILNHTYLDRDDRLRVSISGRGVHRKENALGYQYSLGICNDSILSIRPWPASLDEFDFTPSEIVPGSELVINVNPELVPRFRYGKIGLRVITKDGQVRENFGNCFLSCPPIKGNPSIRRLAENEYEFRFSGTMNSSMSSHSGNSKFSLGVEEGGETVLEEAISPDWQGGFNNIHSFSGTFRPGQVLNLRTSYESSWDSLVVWDTTISFAGEAMFSSIRENEEQFPVITMENLPFEGKMEVEGYKFALADYYKRRWSDSIFYDIRPFSSEGYDFQPVEVTRGNELVLPVHSRDLPSKVIVALKGVTAAGAEQTDEITYSPAPPKPEVIPLELKLGSIPPPLVIGIKKESLNSQVHGIKVWLTDDETNRNLLTAVPPVYVTLGPEKEGLVTCELPNWFFLDGYVFTLKTVTVNLSTKKLSPPHEVRFRFEETDGIYKAVIVEE